ncbi:MAG: hypothetical protein JWL66_2947 [Sphingomonadales bacterium]|jgi:hypothetical protein|nr:hypothetical protein [Sphingomonadales bacterium]
MFARPNAQHSQIAYVTNDIDAAVRLFSEQYDTPGFFVFSNIQPGMEQQGSPQLRIGLARVGGVEIELIEPLNNTAPMFRDFLPQTDELVVRFHHVAIRIDGSLADWNAHVASIDVDAHPIVYSGQMGDDLRFFYTDERATLGHYVEHVWMSASMLAQVAEATPTYPAKVD